MDKPTVDGIIVEAGQRWETRSMGVAVITGVNEEYISGYLESDEAKKEKEWYSKENGHYLHGEPSNRHDLLSLIPVPGVLIPVAPGAKIKPTKETVTVGSVWRVRNGDEVTVMGIDDSGSWPVKLSNSQTCTFFGRCGYPTTEDSPSDLMELVISELASVFSEEPAPQLEQDEVPAAPIPEPEPATVEREVAALTDEPKTIDIPLTRGQAMGMLEELAALQGAGTVLGKAIACPHLEMLQRVLRGELV